MEAINHEYYVSLEVAKLLKEAGFDWKIYDGYITYEDGGGFTTEFQTPHNFNGDSDYLFINYGGHKEVLSRPTIEVAQRWLREVKNIDINVLVESISGHKQYLVSIWFNISSNSAYDNIVLDNRYTTYEEALEAGIKKCLTLILNENEKMNY